MKTHTTLKGTQTEKNIVIAYLAESTAYTRYKFYATKAEKERYFPIAEAFNEIADNEMRHAKVYFKYLEGGQVNVSIEVDTNTIGDTWHNLATAIREEETEGVKLYTASAITADEEGFCDIAKHFRAIAEVEATHKKRFERLLKQLSDDTIWKRNKPTTKWKCLVCGYIYEGTEPPAECPACDHTTEHYIAICDD